METEEKVPEIAEYFYRKAINAYLVESPEKILEYFDRALTAYPGYAKAWNEKGNFLDYLGKYKEAIQCYDKAIKLDPALSEAYFNRGMTLNKMGKTKEAIPCINYGVKRTSMLGDKTAGA